MKLERKLHWQSALTDYLRSIAAIPFSWENHHCLSFASEAVEAMTGYNIAADKLGDYINVCQDEESARAYCRTKGYKSHIHLIARNFKSRPSVLSMNRGDIAVLPDQMGNASLGISQGEKIYMVGPQGLVTVAADHVRKAFAV